MDDRLARNKQLIRACEIVNEDPEVRQIEKEFDALADEVEARWDDARNTPVRYPGVS